MLEVERLQVAYGDATALWDVSLRVGEGELVSVVGPNGSGKTTLINAIAGLLPVRGGRLRFGGQDLTRLAPHAVSSRGIAIVPEGRRLFAGMTVEENLEIGGYAPGARGARGARLERVYAIFPVLRARRRQAAGTLSGGEQQMVALGRALMAGPRLLLLDEPSLGLAPAVVDHVFQVIEALHREGAAVLLVEQNVAKALGVASRAYVPAEGRVVSGGPPAELLGEPHIRSAYLGTFRFTARFGRGVTPRAPDPPPAEGDLRALSVLVVDDNATNRRVLTEILTVRGLSVTAAPDGPTALAALERAMADGARFRLALLDVQMPGMDGFELAQRIKTTPGAAATVVLLLSSGGRPGDGARCREIGVAGYLAKPVGQTALWDAILLALSAPAESGALPALVTRHVLRERQRQLRILLAEDNPVNQRLAMRVLEKQGHEVVVAANGREVADLVERERFDLVLMDVQMPELNGLEATALIRQREAAGEPGVGPPPAGPTSAPGPGPRRRIPIIAMTAHALRGDRERCLAAGMDDYVSKPMKTVDLLAAISRVMGHGSGPATPPASPPVDVPIALRAVDGDTLLLKELVDLFAADYPQRLAEVREALGSGDARRVQQTAHGLKGALGSLGATEAANLAAKLETAGRDRQLILAPTLLQSLEAEIDRVLAFFAEPEPGLQPLE